MLVITVPAAFLAGWAVGAVARPMVFVRAVPRGEPPRRACPHCAAAYPPAGPAGWLVAAARGGCPACGGRTVPVRRAPEWATAVVFAALALSHPAGWTGAAQFWLAALGTALACVDLSVHRLPDVLTLPASAGTLLLLVVAGLAGESGSAVRACAGAAAVTAVYVLLVPVGMGMGDVKLAPATGALLGWSSWGAVFLGVFAGFALAAIAGVLLVAVGRATRASRVAFGPFMVAGALAVSLLAG